MWYDGHQGIEVVDSVRGTNVLLYCQMREGVRALLSLLHRLLFNVTAVPCVFVGNDNSCAVPVFDADKKIASVIAGPSPPFSLPNTHDNSTRTQ